MIIEILIILIIIFKKFNITKMKWMKIERKEMKNERKRKLDRNNNQNNNKITIIIRVIN